MLPVGPLDNCRVEPASFNDRKVEVWLDHQQNQQGPAIHVDSQHGSRKRKTLASSPDDSSLHTQRRRPLRETTMNSTLPDSANPPPSTSPTKSKITKVEVFRPRGQPASRRSPRKFAASPPRDRTAQSSQHGIEDPTTVEPRGRPVGSLETTSPQSQTYSNMLNNLDDLPVSSIILPSTQSRSAQARSASPVKTMQNLAMGNPPITFLEANGGVSASPDKVKLLLSKLLEASEGFGLLPWNLKDEIKRYNSQFENGRLHDVYFNVPESVHPTSAEKERLLQAEDLWKNVQRIRKNARQCSEKGDSEAGWGEKVYSRILDAALEVPDYEGHIRWQNISTARLEPKSLCPVHLSGKYFASKMVDYCLVLTFPSPPQQILEILRDLPEEDQNINQTAFTPMKYEPITVNIEVKVPGQGKNETMVQLSIWVAAQFNKLYALRGRYADIGIPLLSVEGHDWKVHVAYQMNDGSIIILGNNPVGDSMSILGIYKIIATLRLLAEWSHGEYRWWFESTVLGRD